VKNSTRQKNSNSTIRSVYPEYHSYDVLKRCLSPQIAIIRIVEYGKGPGRAFFEVQ
jgi:hypothetical protein